LHKSECQESEPNQLVSLEEPSHDPLANGVSDGFNQLIDSGFVLDADSENGFKEEFVEGIQTVLIHVGHYI